MEENGLINGVKNQTNAQESNKKETELIGTLSLFVTISSYIPGVVYIISGGTTFLGAFVWFLLAIGFAFSFIGIFKSKPRDLALAAFIICILTAMFAVLYPQLDCLTSYVEEMKQINLFNPNSPIYE